MITIMMPFQGLSPFLNEPEAAPMRLATGKVPAAPPALSHEDSALRIFNRRIFRSYEPLDPARWPVDPLTVAFETAIKILVSNQIVD